MTSIYFDAQQGEQGVDLEIVEDSVFEEESEEEEAKMTVTMPTLPANLTFNKKNTKGFETFAAFRRSFESFLKWHKDKDGWKEAHSKRLLFNCLGEAEQIMASEVLSDANIEDETKTFKDVMKNVNELFIPMQQNKMSREAFFRCRQQDTETVSAFAARLRSLYAQAFPEMTEQRKDILINVFCHGLLNDMARYAINTADPPIVDDITKAVQVAERHISAQLASQVSLNKRDAKAQGLNVRSENVTSLDLIGRMASQRHTTSDGMAPYQQVLTGTATQSMNQTSFVNQAVPVQQMQGQQSEVEPMEIGNFYEGSEEEIDPDLECLVEGMQAEHQEAMSLLAAVEAGGKIQDRPGCFYCSSKYHFIRSCPARSDDMAKGIFRGRSNRGGNYRGFQNVRNGRYQRGNYNGRGRFVSRGFHGNNSGYGNRGRSFSAGAMARSDMLVAEEGHPEVDGARIRDGSEIGAMQFGLDALQLSDDQLERIIGIGNEGRLGAIFGEDNRE